MGQWTQAVDRDDVWMRLGVALLTLWMTATLLAPIALLLAKSFQDHNGVWIGWANYATYFSTPSLTVSLVNSLWVSLLTTALVVPMAYAYAYALARTALPGRTVLKSIALIPVLAPSLLPALSLIYLFGNQGLAKDWLAGASIYGPIGIVMSQVFYCFPHALMILLASLAMGDARHYEAARVLGASPWKTFWTITVPQSKYGLVSAAFVVFTLAITDFGIAKVIGGQFNVLATDIFKQVIGQQNFQMGAVVGFVLLIPAGLAFVADRLLQRRNAAVLTSRAVPLSPTHSVVRDAVLLTYCALVASAILLILGMAMWASLVTRWPYNLNLTLANYQFSDFDSGGWAAWRNSVHMALWTAAIGTAIIFTGAYLIEKTRGVVWLRGAAQLMAMLPMAVPGLVLGLAYIFFFNAPGNPLGVLYATMGILVINSITHFYTVGHITATTALKQLDREFESVSASLKVSLARTFTRVTVPVCLPSLLDIAIYLFVNAMTTVSAVVFLYGADTKLASISIVHMDEAGFTAAAAAMALVITATSAGVKLIQSLLSRGWQGRTQRWKQR